MSSYLKLLIFLAIPASLLACTSNTPEQFNISCVQHGNGGPSVLVVGDSWGGKGRLDDGLSRGIAENNGDGKGCSIGLSGRTANEIAEQIAIPKERFSKIILLVGVNDVILHTGAKSYGNGVLNLKKKLEGFSDEIILVSIPRVNLVDGYGSFHGKVKHYVYRWIFDRGVYEVTESYRAEAPNMRTINFDDFISSYAINLDKYVDNAHLTNDGYAKLGYFIGINAFSKNKY